MARDIEEFLKMAAQRRQQQKQRQGQQPQQGAGQRVPPKQPSRPLAAQPVPSAYEPPATEDEIQIIEPQPDIRRGSVREHVQTHIDTSDIAEHVRHLGEEVGMADDKVEARLQQKFDHGVGHLKIDEAKSAQSKTTKVTDRQISDAAAALMNMLRTPTSIRQAILISEVLRRPDFD